MTMLEFLAKWKRTKTKWHVSPTGYIRCAMGWCPLQVMTGDLLDYVTTAKKKFGISRALSSLIIRAADNRGLQGDPSRRLRKRMLASKGL